eukprot:214794_1
MFFINCKKKKQKKIKFKKTKEKPLILQASFYADSTFKTLCFKFIQIFGDKNIEWNPYNKMVIGTVQNGKRKWQYQKNRNRCATICNEFNKCLDKILFKCTFTNRINIDLLNQWYKHINVSSNQIQIQNSYSHRRNNDIELSGECTITVSDNYTWNNYAAIHNGAFWCTYSDEKQKSGNRNTMCNCENVSNRIFQSTNNFTKQSIRIEMVNKMELSSKDSRYERITSHINNMRTSMY